MFGKLFSKPTTEDLLKILRKEPFNEDKADDILESVNINSLDNDGKSFLHHVCIEDISEPIKWLVKNGIDKELMDYYDETALTLAIKNESNKAFMKLLESGFDVDKQNRNGRTIVQDSLTFPDLRFYTRIKEFSKNINNIDKNGRNILFDAVATGNYDIIKEILTEDIDKGLIDKRGKPALLQERVINNLDVLQLLLENDVDISLKDKEGNNLLYYLIKNESINVDVIDYSIENNIDINSVNNFGNTILIEMIYILNDQIDEHTQASEKERIILSTIDKLLENEIDIDIQNSKGRTAVMVAAKLKNDLILKKLIASGAQINLTDNEGNTALSMSIVKGKEYKDIAKILVENRVKVDIKDVNGQSIIDKLIDLVLYTKSKKKISRKLVMKMDDNTDYTVLLKEILTKTKIDLYSLNANNEPHFFEPILYGNIELFKLLIQVGYHINQLDKNGFNVIYKLMNKYEDISNDVGKKYHISLKAVLDMRANVNTIDSFGGTTLHKAILKNDVQTVKMLLNANADLNATDKEGRNFMHNSVWTNRIQIMRVIHNANPKLINATDTYGALPINYAAFLGHTDLVVELIALGSVINNNAPKKDYIIDFTKKFTKNIIPMFKNTRNSSDQRNVAKLIANMRSEFKF